MYKFSNTLMAIALLANPAYAQFVPTEESLSGLYPGKAYSPYANRGFPSNVYWGDTHLHTGLSPDAGLFGNTTGPDEAYQFARGEQVMASSGQPARLARPLDWLVLTEHSDAMGMISDIFAGAPAVVATEQGARWNKALSKGGEEAAAAALDLIANFSQGTVEPALVQNYMPGAPIYNSIWQTIVDAAERYNEPGRFTAFIGFEWTSVPLGNNMHRNVI
ncbi:MAG: DUF3604 domain-containing protein, partial [Boseongicola sp.]